MWLGQAAAIAFAKAYQEEATATELAKAEAVEAEQEAAEAQRYLATLEVRRDVRL